MPVASLVVEIGCESETGCCVDLATSADLQTELPDDCLNLARFGQLKSPPLLVFGPETARLCALRRAPDES